jgi:hypothetical protein
VLSVNGQPILRSETATPLLRHCLEEDRQAHVVWTTEALD